MWIVRETVQNEQKHNLKIRTPPPEVPGRYPKSKAISILLKVQRL